MFRVVFAFGVGTVFGELLRMVWRSSDFCLLWREIIFLFIFLLIRATGRGKGWCGFCSFACLCTIFVSGENP